MAFDSKNLGVLAYANGFTLWHYRAPEGAGLPDLLGPGHFDRAADMLRAGDQIHLELAPRADRAGTGCGGGLLLVAAAAPHGPPGGGRVEVTPLTLIATGAPAPHAGD